MKNLETKIIDAIKASKNHKHQVIKTFGPDTYEIKKNIGYKESYRGQLRRKLKTMEKQGLINSFRPVNNNYWNVGKKKNTLIYELKKLKSKKIICK